MSEKDFLSQFSSDGKKPDSFKEEERIKVEKPKKDIDPKIFIIGGIVLVLLGVLSYFLFFAPKIEMPDFVGQTKDDVSAWVKQQEIETSGIIFKEEYNFDNAEDVILAQDVEAGKKVKKNVKITFNISLGADPEEKVTLPDIKSMTKSELETWISNNKLTKTKITTSYNDSVEEGNVISYEVKGVDEDDFTRSSTLNISVSKGPQPAGTVTVNDFKGQDYSAVENWAKTNKVTNIVKLEAYSDTVTKGLVISQSAEANKSIKTSDQITFTVSKGKGVKVPSFANMSEEDIEKWEEKNKVTVNNTYKYSNSDVTVLSQSVATGSMIAEGDSIDVVLNKGKYFYASDEDLTDLAKVGANVLKLEDWCNGKRSKGIDGFVGDWSGSAEVYSEVYSKGQIVSIEISSYATGQTYDISDRLPLDVRFSVVVSKGKYYPMKSMFSTDKSAGVAKVSDVIEALSSNGITFTLAEGVNDYTEEAKIKDITIDKDLYDDQSYVIEYATSESEYLYKYTKPSE